MAEQIAQMQGELKSYEKKSVHLVLEIKELHLKMDGMNKEIDGIVTKRQVVEKQSSVMKAELHQVMQSLNDPPSLKEGIKKLYQKFVTVAPSLVGPIACRIYTLLLIISTCFSFFLACVLSSNASCTSILSYSRLCKVATASKICTMITSARDIT